MPMSSCSITAGKQMRMFVIRPSATCLEPASIIHAFIFKFPEQYFHSWKGNATPIDRGWRASIRRQRIESVLGAPAISIKYFSSKSGFDCLYSIKVRYVLFKLTLTDMYNENIQ